MSRVKKITKTKAMIVWSVAPIFVFGAITLVQSHNVWETSALYLAWILAGVLLVNAKRVQRRFRRPSRRRSTRTPRSPIVAGFLRAARDVLPWAGPQKQPKPLDRKQMDKWAADELAQLEANADHREVESADGEPVKYSIYGDDDYARKRAAEGYR